MGMSQAIDHAVCQELADENRIPPKTYQEVMGDTYKYNTVTIQGFLKAVASRLQTDIPSYSFNWEALDPEKCVAARVVDLEGMIATKTTLT
jgi:hypothetical protein